MKSSIFALLLLDSLRFQARPWHEVTTTNPEHYVLKPFFIVLYLAFRLDSILPFSLIIQLPRSYYCSSFSKPLDTRLCFMTLWSSLTEAS